MTQIFNAKTVEDAKELAARTFGAPESEIQFEILEEPKKGFFGIGKKGEAKVKATYVPITISEPETDSFAEEIPPASAQVQDFTEAVIEIPQPEPRSENATIAPEEISASEQRSEFATTAPEEISAPELRSENATTAPEEISASEQRSEFATTAPEEISAPGLRSENATTAPEEISASELRSEFATTAPEEISASEPRSENATTAPEEISASEQRSEFATIAPEEISAPGLRSENATIAPEEISAPELRSENATIAPEEIPASEKISSIQPDDELITGEPSAAALAKIEKAKEYLAGILEAMGIKAELKVNAGKESAIIEIQTSNSGAVIGKRGETLDSLQYLTFMNANRTDKEYYRIILNTANYRERRRKTLEELANKIAKNVLHSHRSTTLEPMNPYERRIIHSAIAEIEGVSSKSVGEEPYRKVVISSTEKPQRSGKRRNYHDKNEKHDGRNRTRNHGRRDSSRRNPDAPPTRISMDSMKTSFEKDYKRPRPEDDLNAGLYGKIEF